MQYKKHKASLSKIDSKWTLLGVLALAIGIGTYYYYFSLIPRVETIPPGEVVTKTSDKNNSLVEESKKTVRTMGISEDYFMQHFKLLYAITNPVSSRMVAWQFMIGDYTTTIDDTLNFSVDSPSYHTIKDKLYGFTEIKQVITKSYAEKHMKDCIGDFKDSYVSFAFPKGFNRMTNAPQGVAPNYVVSLYLIARSVEETKNINTQWDVGYIDLQTGECTKGKGGVLHSPMSPSNERK